MLYEKEIIENDRVAFIQKSLGHGKTREEIAVILGYKNWRGLDIFMRRQGMKWDSKQNNYYFPVKKTISIEKADENMPPKIFMVISRFNEKDADPIQIAKQAGFEDHRQLSSYMAARGFIWSADQNNYIQVQTKFQEKERSETGYPEPAVEKENIMKNSTGFEKYQPLFNILLENKEKLLNLLLPVSPTGTIPRYTIPGITRTKSFYMSDLLSKLVCEFSQSKNISQKEIIEAALIEFLRKYSFAKEVDAVIGKG